MNKKTPNASKRLVASVILTSLICSMFPVSGVMAEDISTQEVLQETPSETQQITEEQEEEEYMLDLGNEQAEMDAYKDFTAVVRQTKPYYCGPAALATLRTQLGETTSEAEVLDLIPTEEINEEKGTNLLALKKAAEQLGSQVTLKKWSASQVLDYTSQTHDPVLIHDEKKNVGGHFSVIREYDVEKQTIELSDTEAGNIKYSVEDFQHIYTGSALVIFDGEKSNFLTDPTTDISETEAAQIWGKYVPVSLVAETIAGEKAAVSNRLFIACTSKALQIQEYTKRNQEREKCYQELGKNLDGTLNISEELKTAAIFDISKVNFTDRTNEFVPGTANILKALRDSQSQPQTAVLPNQRIYIQAQSDYMQWITKATATLGSLDSQKILLSQYLNKLTQAQIDRSILDKSFQTKSSSIKSLQTEIDRGYFVQNGMTFSLGNVSSSLKATQSNFQNLSSNLQSKLADYDRQAALKQKDIASYQKSKNQAISEAANFQWWADWYYRNYFNTRTRRWSGSWYSSQYTTNLNIAASRRVTATYYQSQIDKAYASIAAINNAKSSAKNVISSLFAEQSRLQRIKDFGEQEIRRKKALLETLKVDLGKVQSQLKDRDSAITTYQQKVTSLKDQVNVLQNVQSAKNKMESAKKVIDQVKTSYGFTTLTYTNTQETERLISEELKNEKMWDQEAINAATLRLGQAMNDGMEYARNHQGEVVVVGGVSILFLAGAAYCEAASLGACTSAIAWAGSAGIAIFTVDVADKTSILLTQKNLFGKTVSDQEWSQAFGQLGLDAISLGALKATVEAAKGVTGAKTLINRYLYSTSKAEIRNAELELKNIAAKVSIAGQGVGKTSLQLTDEVVTLARANNLSENALKHVLLGEVKNGYSGGWHYRGWGNGSNEIISIKTAPDSFGIYEAKVKIQGVEKSGISTFFPDAWTPQDIVDGVKNVMKSGSILSDDLFVKEGNYKGIVIRVIFEDSQKTILKTFYPIYVQ